jgi:Immunoglobulin V-set domain
MYRVGAAVPGNATYNVSVPVGDTVHMSCTTSLRDVDWSRVDSVNDSLSRQQRIYSDGRLFINFQSRFAVHKSSSTSNNFTLTISDLTFGDSGIYVCLEDSGLGRWHVYYLNVTGYILFSPIPTKFESEF